MKNKIFGALQRVGKSLNSKTSGGENANEEVKLETRTESAQVESSVAIYAPLEGKAVPLKEVNDGVFSEDMLGKGMAIEPTIGKVAAPFDGKVTMIYTTKHAIALTSNEGIELLIHVGIDTVQLNGKYYDIKVAVGDEVKAGDLLAEFDIKGIESEGYRTITPVIIANTDAYKDVVGVASGEVKIKDRLLNVLTK